MIDTPDLIGELTGALAEIGAKWEFQVSASAPPYEIAALVERQKPDVVLVELASVSGSALEWINIVRSGSELPLVIAVHIDTEPAGMISAMRAGASEFLSSPVRPAVFETMDRIATQLEARQTTSGEPGKFLGVLGAKGGCGATTFACHLAVAMQMICPEARILLADLDHQAPSAHRVLRVAAITEGIDAFHSVRRLNSACWQEFVSPINSRIDMLSASLASGPPETWRIDNLFRFVRRHYGWIVADLGRHLNPSNWSFLPSVEELFLVTAPDVLALYQTRSVLQTLTSRGFDKAKVRLILNRNQNAPQDFWIESIEQMFDLKVAAVLPYDKDTLAGMSRERFDFPAASGYGRAVSKIARRIVKPNGPDSSGSPSSFLSFRRKAA